MRARQAHLAARLGAQQLHAAQAVVGLVDEALAVHAKRFARWREAEAARAALRERHAEARLERTDVAKEIVAVLRRAAR
jgi:hypothetical protein